MDPSFQKYTFFKCVYCECVDKFSDMSDPVGYHLKRSGVHPHMAHRGILSQYPPLSARHAPTLCSTCACSPNFFPKFFPEIFSEFFSEIFSEIFQIFPKNFPDFSEFFRIFPEFFEACLLFRTMSVIPDFTVDEVLTSPRTIHCASITQWKHESRSNLGENLKVKAPEKLSVIF